jgi:hypothetical protein
MPQNLPAGTGLLNSIGDDLDMTAEQVRKAREQAPFKPFTIYLSDQRRFEINHQDSLWVAAVDFPAGDGWQHITELVPDANEHVWWDELPPPEHGGDRVS